MTIRYFAWLATCIAIALVPLPRSSKAVLTNTGLELDVAIVGRGNFCLVDQDSAECFYTRCGHLVLNSDGQLAVKTDGSQWRIDPPIHIPSDWERLAILTDGRVQLILHEN